MITNVQELRSLIGGVTYDDAVQRALSYGGSIYFPEGTYRLTQPLSIPSGTRLFGDGPASVLNITARSGLSNGGVSGVTIEDLAITGAMAFAIGFSNASDIALRRLRISGATQPDADTMPTAVMLAGVADVLVEDCVFTGNGLGAAVHSAVINAIGGQNCRVKIRGNTLRDNAASLGIFLMHPADCEVANNFVNQGNVCLPGDNNGYGIALYDTGAGNRVANNTVRNCAGSAIYLNGIAASVVSANVIAAAAQQQQVVSLCVGGIALGACDGCSIAGNVVDGSGASGIDLVGSGNALVGNVLRNCTGGYPVWIRVGSKGNVLDGNAVGGCPNGIYDQGTGTQLGVNG